MRAGCFLNSQLVDWFTATKASALGVDRNRVRLFSSSTADRILRGQSWRAMFDHLSTAERREPTPRSALTFEELLFPVCKSEHWVAVRVLPARRMIYLYDSLRGRKTRPSKCNRDIASKFLDYLAHHQKEVGPAPNVPRAPSDASFGIEFVTNIPT